MNQVTETLYQEISDAGSVRLCNPSELEQDIRPTGFFRNKTKSVMGASKAILEKFRRASAANDGGDADIPGVARKTANVVLGTAYGIASGVVVDTHVMRLSNRLDLSHERRSEKDRAGSDEDSFRRTSGFVFASADLARAARLPCAQTEMRGLQSGIALHFQKTRPSSESAFEMKKEGGSCRPLFLDNFQ